MHESPPTSTEGKASTQLVWRGTFGALWEAQMHNLLNEILWIKQKLRKTLSQEVDTSPYFPEVGLAPADNRRDLQNAVDSGTFSEAAAIGVRGYLCALDAESCLRDDPPDEERCSRLLRLAIECEAALTQNQIVSVVTRSLLEAAPYVKKGRKFTQKPKRGPSYHRGIFIDAIRLARQQYAEDTGREPTASECIEFMEQQCQVGGIIVDEVGDDGRIYFDLAGRMAGKQPKPLAENTFRTYFTEAKKIPSE